MGINAKLTFVDHPVPDLEGDDVAIIRLELWQAVSELFTLTLRLRADASQIELREVAGQMVEVALFVENTDALPQPFLPRIRGLVRRARQLSTERTGRSTYELVIVPPLWLATQRLSSGIANNLSAPATVQRICEMYQQHGFPMMSSPLGPPEPAVTREYMVQYNERDLDFMRRILARDGIAFYFAGDALEEWHLSGDTSRYTSPVHAELPFAPSGDALTTDVDVVLSASYGTALATRHQAVRDYHFSNPFFHPMGKYQDEGGVEMMKSMPARVYYEGQLHESKDERVLMSDEDQKGRAQTWLEGSRRHHETLVAELSCALPAGARLTITGDHPAAGRPQLVVRSLSLLEIGDDASEARVARSHRVECIPADYPYRPPQLPRPRIEGLQRAAVSGSEEIDVDEHGRVMVVFQWDQSADNWTGPPQPTGVTTRRIQVAQDWAGPNRGLLTLPRLGDEVIVAYIDGDVDEPVIVGRLYNGRNRAAVELPGDRTQSVWRTQSSPNGEGFHEIRFEDKLGGEELHVEAERLSTHLAKGDQQVTVQGGRQLTVGGDEQIDVHGSRQVKVGGDQTVTIEGSLDITATNITETASNQHKINAPNTIVETGIRREFSSVHVIDSGQVLVTGCVVTVEASNIKLVAGGSLIELGDGGIKIQGPIVQIN